MLKEKIQADLTQSLKDKLPERTSTLRLLLSDVKNIEINTRKDVSDEEIIQLVQKQIKKLEEAVEMFTKGGRTDLVDENKVQITILSEYLPAQLSDDELSAQITTIIENNAELYAKNRNAIMGIAMKELGGKADSKRIMAELQKPR